MRRGVNRNLELRFTSSGLTSYAGLELVRRYFASLAPVPVLRRELGTTLPRSDFGAVRMVLMVLAVIIAGGRRLRHLLFFLGRGIGGACASAGSSACRRHERSDAGWPSSGREICWGWSASIR